MYFFFGVEKTVINLHFQVAGAIVTYELVIIQFNDTKVQ